MGQRERFRDSLHELPHGCGGDRCAEPADTLVQVIRADHVRGAQPEVGLDGVPNSTRLRDRNHGVVMIASVIAR